MRVYLLASTVLFFLTPMGAHAQAKLDPASAEALQQTTELLKNKKVRESAIAKDPKAVQADEFVKSVAGNAELTDEIYELASEVFPMLVSETGGDVSKMADVLKDFSKNPGSFAAKWTPEQREKLEKLSKKLSPKQSQH